MIRKLLLLFCIIFSFNYPNFSQTGSVGIGTTNPNNSAALEIQSTSKGLLLPRVSTVQRSAIANPAIGLLVFDTDKNCLFLFDGVAWRAIGLVEGNNFPPIEREASDGKIGNQFGWSVSMSGNYAIVGAPYDSVNSNDMQGSAYIFVRQGSNWVQQAKLTASDGAALEWFGYSVAISGDVAVVGCPYDDVVVLPFTYTDRGSIYVFTRNGTTWTQSAKLIANDGLQGEAFGWSVSISGNLIVAAPESGRNASNVYTGCAYVFSYNSGAWTQQSKLFPSDGAEFDHYGGSVSISGDNIVIGASGHGVGGAAYVYLRFLTSWLLDEKLPPSTIQTGAFFGSRVQINGSKIMVSATAYDGYGGNNQGAVYTYIKNGSNWSPVYTFIADDGSGGDILGSSIASFGNFGIIGASGDRSDASIGLGSAYLLKAAGDNNWALIRKIQVNSNAYSFGHSIAMDGLNIIIGAPSSTDNKGKVYFLNIE